MQVQEIMTANPECCMPGDSAKKAAAIMKATDAGVVPVVRDGIDLQLVGIVTDRDLCLTVIAEGRDPCSVKLEECMAKKPVSCHPEDDVQHVSNLMAVNQIRRIPVVDQNAAVIGIVSLGDIAHEGVVGTLQAGANLREISEPTGEPSKPRAQEHS